MASDAKIACARWRIALAMLHIACGPDVPGASAGADVSSSAAATDASATALLTSSSTDITDASTGASTESESGTTSEPPLSCEPGPPGTWTPIADAPGPRSDVSIVYTGDEVIVWGGFVDASELGVSALRHDVDADTWAIASVIDEPTARSGHAAVWTGTQMIVWGGSILVDPRFSAYEYFDDGGRYDPASDSWSATSMVDAPTARSRHKALWTGEHMLVFGGTNTNVAESVVDQGGRYDPIADVWSPMTPVDAPLARGNFAFAWTGTEALVWGGFGRVDRRTLRALGEGALYNPANDTWRPMTLDGAPAPTRVAEAVWTGEVVIVYSERFVALYDPTNDEWLDVVTPCDERSFPSVVWTGVSMLVWGGTYLPPRDCRLNCYGDFVPDLLRVGSDAAVLISSPDGGLGEREGAAVAWTGAGLWVWGGRDQLTFATASGAIYAP